MESAAHPERHRRRRTASRAVEGGGRRRRRRSARGRSASPRAEEHGAFLESTIHPRDVSHVQPHKLDRVPKTLTGEELQLDDAPARDAELFLVDGNNLAYRAFFALPEELRRPTGSRRTRCSASRTCSSSSSPTTGRAASRSRGTRDRCTARSRRGLQGGAPSDARPPARAVPALPSDRRGVRLPEPRVRGLGGRRRDRDARHPRGRGGHQDVRRLDRPRRLPARARRTSA